MTDCRASIRRDLREKSGEGEEEDDIEVEEEEEEAQGGGRPSVS